MAGEVEHLPCEERLRRNLAAAFPVPERRYKKKDPDSTGWCMARVRGTQVLYAVRTSHFNFRKAFFYHDDSQTAGQVIREVVQSLSLELFKA